MSATRIIIYPRVSSAEQVAGYSIEAQIETCQNWAASHGHDVVKIFPEPGKSARTDKRPAFQDAIQFVLTGGADAILVHRADRFARNLFDYLYYRSLLERQGKMILSATESFFNSSTPETRMLSSIVVAVGEFIAARIGQETIKGTQEKARQGKWPGGKPPHGYKRVNKDCIIMDPDLGPAISQAFFDFSTGQYTLDTWAAEATARGITTPRGQPINRAVWHGIFTNIFFTGKFIWRDEEFDGDHPPLVSNRIFDLVQALLADRNSGGAAGRREWLLRGLVWSDLYQMPMHGSSSKNDYYRAKPKTGSEHNVRADDLEHRVVEQLDNICWDKGKTLYVPDKWRMAIKVTPHLGQVWKHLHPDEHYEFLNLVINPHGVVVAAGGAIKKIHIRSGFFMNK